MKNWHKNLVAEYKKGHLGYASIAIIGQSCLGAIAAMYILKTDHSDIWGLFQLFLVTAGCMAFNGDVLTHQKAQFTINLLIISLALSIALIILNNI